MPRAAKTPEPKKAAPKKAPPKKAPAKAAVAAKSTAKTATAVKATTKAAPPAKAAKDAKPAKKSSAAADKFVEGQRKLLLEEREAYTRQAMSLRAEAEQLAAEREPGDVQFDEESGEGDTMNVERERDLALSAQAMGAVDEIDRSLAKIDAGTYGICEKCGEPIPKERLRALPYAALCVKCKSMGLSRR
jgi:DnaK suppressor protein